VRTRLRGEGPHARSGDDEVASTACRITASPPPPPCSIHQRATRPPTEWAPSRPAGTIRRAGQQRRNCRSAVRCRPLFINGSGSRLVGEHRSQNPLPAVPRPGRGRSHRSSHRIAGVPTSSTAWRGEAVFGPRSSERCGALTLSQRRLLDRSGIRGRGWWCRGDCDHLVRKSSACASPPRGAPRAM
jgi:hypothetical protein